MVQLQLCLTLKNFFKLGQVNKRHFTAQVILSRHLCLEDSRIVNFLTLPSCQFEPLSNYLFCFRLADPLSLPKSARVRYSFAFIIAVCGSLGFLFTR